MHTRYAFLGLLAFVAAACRNPTPAYPRPVLTKSDPSLLVAFSNLSHQISLIADESRYDADSFSVSVTSESGHLWSYHHTAKELDPKRPGANPVDGDSFYRVASITKVFATHAILQLYAAGKLSLEDPIVKHLPELRKGLSAPEGGIDWDRITLRALASQISGIPRDWSQGDYLSDAPGHLHGFPPPVNKHLPKCFGFSNYSRPCNETDLYEDLRRHRPVALPNQLPSYSNTAFELLGLVVATVSGQSFVDYVTANILERYFVTPGATFEAPPDKAAALSKAGAWYFNVDLGIHIPAGGLYASTNGLDQYLRTALAQYKLPAFGGPDVNMFNPQGYNFGAESAYGLTWEIFRTNKMLSDQRPVTFYTKGGGHPGYITIIMAVPDLGLGITILCTGDKASELLNRLRELVSVEVVRAVDHYAEKLLRKEYVGDFTFEKLLDTDGLGQIPQEKVNTSLSIAYSSSKGLHLASVISNGTDLLASLGALVYGNPDRRLEIQLIPTGQYAQLSPAPHGEVWRGLIWQEKTDNVWSDFCINDVDGPQYDGRPLLQVVFSEDRQSVELIGLRTRLKRSTPVKSVLQVQDL
jgi:CubicO group peptidase (beta-lactamase class C family)